MAVGGAGSGSRLAFVVGSEGVGAVVGVAVTTTVWIITTGVGVKVMVVPTEVAAGTEAGGREPHAVASRITSTERAINANGILLVIVSRVIVVVVVLGVIVR